MDKSKTATYRQGDVLLRRVDAMPKQVKALRPELGRVILAHGEVTGHHHSLCVEDATLFADDATSARFLCCIRDAVLEHQEHDPIALPAGTYEVVRQNEYTPGEIRRVAD